MLIFVGQFIVSNTPLWDFSSEEEISLEIEQDSEENQTKNESEKDFYLNWNSTFSSAESISDIENTNSNKVTNTIKEIHIAFPTPPPQG